MVPLKLPIFKKGQFLKAADLMALRAAIMRGRLTTGQSSGVTLQETPDGTTIRVDPSETSGIFYAQPSTPIPGTSGSWPASVVLSSITADVYQRTNGDIVLFEEDATVWNAMPDDTIPNRRLILSLNPDGTYDCIGMSCKIG